MSNRQIDRRFHPEDLIIRPAALSDIGDFYDLACLAGAGFTSLPIDEAHLYERLSLSEKSFAGASGALMLAVEDRRSRVVVGCAAIKPGGTPRDDFLNFMISKDELSLLPTTIYSNLTEIGSLLLHPDYRCAGIGHWLALSRYLLIAADTSRFGEFIFSEIRGVVDEQDQSLFYDAVCAPYFNRSYADADDLCGRGFQAKLNALLPNDPIPLAKLSDQVLAVIGKPHRSARRALNYLIDEGFRFKGVVDLLDGGPALVASSRSLKTIRKAIALPLLAGNVDENRARTAYLAVGKGPSFRVGRVPIQLHNHTIICSPGVLAMLKCEGGMTAWARFEES